ncbi:MULTISPECIES: WecB/TagA/CpsF family glycosyltransferase [Spirulina sp. CCY15215]|uniref:WecB/TagA/CpsF family glycosyltransferase n=1 Tax=Spirulina sp. CCY15215 TaxID=2767591 RepID=UPI0019529BE0|nr:WecB/TagA/CpsF family glycosyltransferase [Spirulina major]
MSVQQLQDGIEAPKQFSVFQLPVHLCDDYPRWLRSRLLQDCGTHVVTLNAEMAMQAESNPPLAAAIAQADLVIPDGVGVVFYLRLRQQFQRRCPGIELAASLLEIAGEEGEDYPIAFYGGAPGVAEQAACHWRDRFPSLSMMSSHGYLSDSEQANFQAQLQEKQPKLILVGLGVPRQEYWIAENRALCPKAIWIGVGGSLDIWAGVKSRAPRWLRENNLEWFYRLYKEPWRWRRMLALPHFAWRSLVG